MKKKPSVKKVPRTVYFEPDDLEYLEEEGRQNGRKLSQQIKHMTDTHQRRSQAREKANLEAIRMAVEGILRQGLQQSPESDESSSNQPK